MCHIQRSRGYLQRNAFDLATIRKIADTARAANPEIIIFVDNCYGEFTQTQEPCQVGADIAVGSLIKNPGGGIAPTGGYIVGRKDLVELCAYRLNAPGLGKELGCTLETPRNMYLASTTPPVWCCEAIKTAIYAQCMLELLGKKPIPRYCEAHNDIVTCFDAGTAEALIGFCQGIQAASPVDSYAAPEPSRSRLHRRGGHGKRQLYTGQHHRAFLRRSSARPLYLLFAGRLELCRQPRRCAAGCPESLF